MTKEAVSDGATPARNGEVQSSSVNQDASSSVPMPSGAVGVPRLASNDVFRNGEVTATAVPIMTHQAEVSTSQDAVLVPDILHVMPIDHQSKKEEGQQQDQSEKQQATEQHPSNVALDVHPVALPVVRAHRIQPSKEANFCVKVPEHVRPGETFLTFVPEKGRLINVRRAPTSCTKSGQPLVYHFFLPPPTKAFTVVTQATEIGKWFGRQWFSCIIPESVQPGEFFHVYADHRVYKVLCPRFVLRHLGRPCMFRLPRTAPTTPQVPQAMPCSSDVGQQNYHLVQVPMDVAPGEAFPVRVGTHVHGVTCPLSKGPGQWVLFRPVSNAKNDNATNSAVEESGSSDEHWVLVTIPPNLARGMRFVLAVDDRHFLFRNIGAPAGRSILIRREQLLEKASYGL